MLTRRHHNCSREPGTIVILVVLLFLLSGCGLLRPRERIVTQRDTTIINRRDSIRLRDSIYVREWMKGDTVYVDRFRTATCTGTAGVTASSSSTIP